VSLDSSCVLLGVVMYHWIVVVYYYGSTQSCSTGWHCSSCALLVDFHGDYQFTLGVVECYLIAETVTDDSSYRWHCGSCVLPADCRVVSGLLDEDIVKDTSLAKREC
jgi:hypothetical protein